MDGDALRKQNMRHGAEKTTPRERSNAMSLFGRQYKFDGTNDYSDLSGYEEYAAPGYPFEGGTHDSGMKYGKQYRQEFSNGDDDYELFRYEGGDFNEPYYNLWKNGRDTGLHTPNADSIDEYINILNENQNDSDALMRAIDAWDKKYGG